MSAKTPVEAFDALGNIRGQYESIHEAARGVGGWACRISKAITRPGELSASGFFWRVWTSCPKIRLKTCPRCKCQCDEREFYYKKSGKRRSYCGSCQRLRNRDYNSQKESRLVRDLTAIYRLHCAILTQAITGKNIC